MNTAAEKRRYPTPDRGVAKPIQQDHRIFIPHVHQEPKAKSHDKAEWRYRKSGDQACRNGL